MKPTLWILWALLPAWGIFSAIQRANFVFIPPHSSDPSVPDHSELRISFGVSRQSQTKDRDLRCTKYGYRNDFC